MAPRAWPIRAPSTVLLALALSVLSRHARADAPAASVTMIRTHATRPSTKAVVYEKTEYFSGRTTVELSSGATAGPRAHSRVSSGATP
jgi:hypothetical protein